VPGTQQLAAGGWCPGEEISPEFFCGVCYLALASRRKSGDRKMYKKVPISANPLGDSQLGCSPAGNYYGGEGDSSKVVIYKLSPQIPLGIPN